MRDWGLRGILCLETGAAREHRACIAAGAPQRQTGWSNVQSKTVDPRNLVNGRERTCSVCSWASVRDWGRLPDRCRLSRLRSVMLGNPEAQDAGKLPARHPKC